MEKEFWATIPGTNDLYSVSSRGLVKSYIRNHSIGIVLRQSKCTGGYLQVNIKGKILS